MNRKMTGLVEILSAILLLMPVVGMPVNAESEGKKIVRLTGGDYGFPSPFSYYQRGPGYSKMKLIFESLVEKDENDIIPWLAASWDISGDGLIYSFHLREGVKWQDGDEFTADDVTFTIDYILEKVGPNPSSWVDLSPVNRTEKVDKYTVRIILDEPNAPFLYNNIYGLPIIPKHIWETVDDPLVYHEVDEDGAAMGTGPYELIEYDSAQGKYLFRENENYWYADPAVDEIQFVPISLEMEQLAFQNGEIDAVHLDQDQFDTLDMKEQYAAVKSPAFWGYKLYFQMEARPELKDKTMRQVIAYAIDREDIVSRIGLGLGQPGNPGYLSPSHRWYDPDVEPYSHDKDKAKELMESLGYSKSGAYYEDRNGKTLEFTILTGQDAGRMHDLYFSIASEVKDDLEAAGIKAAIQSVERKTKDSRCRTGDYELAINGHGGWGGDPDLLRMLFLSTGNSWTGVKGYSPSRNLTDLLESQKIETDEENRKDQVFQIQEIMAEELPMLPLWNIQTWFVYNKEAHDGWYFPFDHHVPEQMKLSFIRGTPGVTESESKVPTSIILGIIGTIIGIIIIFTVIRKVRAGKQM